MPLNDKPKGNAKPTLKHAASGANYSSNTNVRR